MIFPRVRDLQAEIELLIVLILLFLFFSFLLDPVDFAFHGVFLCPCITWHSIDFYPRGRDVCRE